jgi:hypothetical protein
VVGTGYEKDTALIMKFVLLLLGTYVAYRTHWLDKKTASSPPSPTMLGVSGVATLPQLAAIAMQKSLATRVLDCREM